MNPPKNYNKKMEKKKAAAKRLIAFASFVYTVARMLWVSPNALAYPGGFALARRLWLSPEALAEPGGLGLARRLWLSQEALA